MCNKVFLLAAGFLLACSLNGQSPPNLSSNVAWTSGTSTIADIENAFNHGRRQEEIQFSLPVNSLGSLALPLNWMTQSIQSRLLYLINAERSARHGADYDGAGPNPPVIGIPFSGVESNVNAIAQTHANDMIANNYVGHTNSSGIGPFTRIDNDPVIGNVPNCHEDMSRVENLSTFIQPVVCCVAMAAEQSVFHWIYEDEAASWGHREACLLQDLDVNGLGTGFVNNNGAMVSEGFIGIGYAHGLNFMSPGWYGEVIVFDMFDPVSDPNTCAYVPFSALPLELLSFSGQSTGNTNLLEWKTANESNTMWHLIERSERPDLDGWTEAGRVGAAGFNSGEVYYQFVDKKPKKQAYYRLRTIDRDGSEQYSEVIFLERTDEPAGLRIYPTIVQDVLYLQTYSNVESIRDMRIVNAAGMIEMNLVGTTALEEHKINVSELPAGHYFLCWIDAEREERTCSTFIKRK